MKVKTKILTICGSENFPKLSDAHFASPVSSMGMLILKKKNEAYSGPTSATY